MADIQGKDTTPTVLSKAKLLAAGGVVAVAATIGTQVDFTPKPEPVPISMEIARARKGDEIISMREANKEVFKADSAWVHPKDVKGAIVKTDSFKVAAFTARVYARPKYFRDADGDTLRPLDLTVREISGLARLNPLKTHDKYVDAGPYDARWMNDKPGDFRMDAGTAYVKYRAIFDTARTVTAVQATADGMKETVTLADSTAPKTLRWVVETDGSLVANAQGGFDVRAKTGAVPMRIQRPVAWDAESKPVMASATVEGDTLTFRVTVLPGQKYPVVVDPTTVYLSNGLSGQAYSYASASYLMYSFPAAKTTATASIAYSNYYIQSGIQISGSEGSSVSCIIFRGFMCFPDITAYMVACSACTLYVNGAAKDTSATYTDKYNYLFGANSYKSTLTTADFSHFDGWSTTNLGGTQLAAAWSTADYSSGWNKFVFTSAGRDSVIAASGDTLWIAMASYDDVHNNTSGIGSSNYVNVSFEYSGLNIPYLSYTYTSEYAHPPTGYVLHTATTSTIKASWTNNHTTGIDSLTRYTGAGAYSATLAKTDTSETISGLTAGTQYIYKARVDSGGEYAYSNADTLYTLANPPASWAFTEDYTDSTKVNIGFSANSNGSAVTYAIRDSTNQKWINATGDTTSTQTWRTYAQWVALGKLINRVASQKQRFGVLAKNGDGVETTYIWGVLTIGNVHHAEITATMGVGAGSTHNGKSTVYSNQARTVNPDSIFSRALIDTIGQVMRGTDYQTWRTSLQFKIPDINSSVALTCTLYTTGAKDSSAVDFNIIAAKGLWNSSANADSQYHNFSGYGGGAFLTANMLNLFGTSSYAAAMKWPFSITGLTWLYQADNDTLRMTIFSSKDSSATAPVATTGPEYIVLDSANPPVLHMDYVAYDQVPSNVVVTAISKDSLLVAWTDNCNTETGFAMVDMTTGLRFGGNDSTTASPKRLGGLRPNKLYQIGVMVLGGKLAGDISASNDYCYTYAATPVAPAVTMVTDSTRKIVIDTTGTGNPSGTYYAIQDSATQKFITSLAGVCSLYTLYVSPPSSASGIWFTYPQWGGANGDTVKYPVGHRSAFRIWSKSVPATP